MQIDLAFPHDGDRKEFNACLIALEAIRHSELCVLGGPEVELELDGVITMVRGLSEGVGPKAEKVCTYSPYFKKCIKNAENFVVVDVPAAGKVKAHTLFGPKAIEFKITNIGRRMKAGTGVAVSDLKHLRVFDWMLTDDMRDMREDWMKDVLKDQGAKLHTAIADGDAADGKGGVEPKKVADGKGAAAKAAKALNISDGLELMKVQPIPSTGSTASGGSSSSSSGSTATTAATKKKDESNKSLLKFFTPATKF